MRRRESRRFYLQIVCFDLQFLCLRIADGRVVQLRRPLGGRRADTEGRRLGRTLWKDLFIFLEIA